jgi:nucleoside-diphosphate-sugar epimerase/predicted transcriptional regulator
LKTVKFLRTLEDAELIQNLSAPSETTILEAMKIIERGGLRTAFIVKDKKLVGTLADGDIRRALLRGVGFETPVSEIMTKNPLVLKEKNRERDLLNIMLEFQVFIIPILNQFKEIIGAVSLPQVLSKFIDLEPKLEMLKEGFKKDLNLPQILIIGGAGYIGSVLSTHLAKKGYFVRILDIFYYGMDSYSHLSSFENIEIYKGEMKSINTLEKVMQDMDYVIHLGAIVGDPACNSTPDLAIQSNLFATQQIVDICKKLEIRNFIFASTCSVYGAGETKDKLTEESPLKPVSLYAQTKIDSEKYILGKKDGKFRPIILRFATAFGRSYRMRFDLAINVMTANCVFHKQLNIFSGEQWRPFIHIRDIANIIEKIIEKGNKNFEYSVYNCGFNELNYLIKDLVPPFQSVFQNIEVNVDLGKEDNRTYKVSFNRIKAELNPKLQFPIEKGIKEVALFLEKKQMKVPNFDFSSEKYSNFKIMDLGNLQGLYFIE